MVKFGIGQSVRRSEDVRFITGHGRYTDDITLARQSHAFILRSPHAHAKITRIDVEAARQAPGVLAVFTGGDIQRDGLGTIPILVPINNRDGSKGFVPPQALLTHDRARFVGDSVAMVVGETLAAAREAADLIEVDYDPLPTWIETAVPTDAALPPIWPEAAHNVALDWEIGNAQATAEAFAKARHVVTERLINNRVVSNPIEERVALGEWDEGTQRFTLHTSSQGSHTLRKMLAHAIFHLPETSFRVITPDVGGGFGTKIFLYREYALVLYAAKKLGRPVKWTGERTDGFLTDAHGRDNVTDVSLALDDDGRFLAIRVETIGNVGAYLSNYGTFVPTLAGTPMLTGVYAIPAAHARVRCVFTNTTPVDAYRGAGRPEAAYVIERIIDIAARRLGLSPADLRRRNFIRPEETPYKTALGPTFDSGEFQRNLEDALAACDFADFEARRKAARARGKLLGFGYSTYIEICGGGMNEGAEIRFDPSGSVSLVIGTQSTGQGHQTAYAQLIAERLGLPFESIRVVQGDTDVVAFGRGTGGSRSLPVGGVAVEYATRKVIERGRKIAAHRLEAAEADIEFDAGRFSIAGTDRSIGLVEVVQAAFNPLMLPPGFEPGFNETAHFTPSAGTFPNGCHACELEIDPDTGTTRILRYVVVDDFGTVVNPLLLAGQVHGGIAQGIGQALLENCVYDNETGQLLSGSLMDYTMPRADDVPAIEFSYNVVPCRTNPLGIKGAGEAGSIGAPPAVINAIVDALAEFGVDHVDMPATPEKLWRLVEAGRSRQAAE